MAICWSYLALGLFSPFRLLNVKWHMCQIMFWNIWFLVWQHWWKYFCFHSLPLELICFIVFKVKNIKWIKLRLYCFKRENYRLQLINSSTLFGSRCVFISSPFWLYGARLWHQNSLKVNYFSDLSKLLFLWLWSKSHKSHTVEVSTSWIDLFNHKLPSWSDLDLHKTL